MVLLNISIILHTTVARLAKQQLLVSLWAGKQCFLLLLSPNKLNLEGIKRPFVFVISEKNDKAVQFLLINYKLICFKDEVKLFYYKSKLKFHSVGKD